MQAMPRVFATMPCRCSDRSIIGLSYYVVFEKLIIINYYHMVTAIIIIIKFNINNNNKLVDYY